MKIEKALKQLKKHKGKATLTSKSTSMYRQDEGSLLYWVFLYDGDKQQYYGNILKATDWEIVRNDP